MTHPKQSGLRLTRLIGGVEILRADQVLSGDGSDRNQRRAEPGTRFGALETEIVSLSHLS